MKKHICMAALLCLLIPAGCAAPAQAPTPEPTPDLPDKTASIPFEEGQLYAGAYLGYQEITELAPYAERYLDSDALPVHYLSGGDFYLIIPRYEDMELQLFRNDIKTSASTLFYSSPVSSPFIIQCNVSDIFPDLTVRLTRQGESVEFSPFISLENGSVQLGERGLDLASVQ